MDNCTGAIKLIRRTSKATLGFKRSQQQYLARTSAGRGSKRPLSDGVVPMKPPDPEKEKRQPKKPEETD